LQKGQSLRASSSGHDLGDQRHADGKLAANAQPRKETIERKVVNRDRQGAQTGADRIHQDRDQHRLGSTNAITQHAENQSARRPACNEHAGGDIAECTSPKIEFVRVALQMRQQVSHRLGTGQDEQLLVEAVEEPTERRDRQYEPVIPIHRRIPATAALGLRVTRVG
jgi:hypothetical protein